MTLADIQKRLDKIAALAGDPESAHVAEDQLHDALLKFLARRDDEVGALCRLALQSDAIEFERWYA